MKIGRQSKIVELITSNEIETQEDLTERLVEAGYKVTQATVSRDIRDLKIIKVVSESGRQKYAMMSNTDGPNPDKFIRILKDSFVSMDKAQNILVIKTVPGMAMAAAAALDSLNFDTVVGCIAGDDTIMCVIRTEADVLDIMNRLRKYLKVRDF